MDNTVSLPEHPHQHGLITGVGHDGWNKPHITVSKTVVLTTNNNLLINHHQYLNPSIPENIPGAR